MKLYILIVSILFAQLTLTQEFGTKAENKIWSLQECIRYAIINNFTVNDANLSKGIILLIFVYIRTNIINLPENEFTYPNHNGNEFYNTRNLCILRKYKSS